MSKLVFNISRTCRDVENSVLMTILASFDTLIVRIGFDFEMHSTDLLSSFRFRSAGTLGVLRGVYYIFSYLTCCDSDSTQRLQSFFHVGSKVNLPG